MWSEETPFDYDKEYLKLSNVVAKPKLYSDGSPLIINAGQSQTGREFALRHCHAFFTNFRGGCKRSADFVSKFKSDARALGREANVYTQGHVVCRPTRSGGRTIFCSSHYRRG